MMIQAEIGEDGTLKIKNLQQWLGREIRFQWTDVQLVDEQVEPNGDAILRAFQEADRLDFPRRSHDELLRELREDRE